MEYFFIAVCITLFIYFIIKKLQKEKQYKIEIDVPNPETAPTEKVLNFLQETEPHIVIQCFDKLKSRNIDFKGLDDYFEKAIQGQFDLAKAKKELGLIPTPQTKVKRKTKLEAPEEVNFDHFNKPKIPSKARQQSSKIPSKYLNPIKDLEDKTHVFYGKKVVISGVYDNFPYRAEIARLLWEVGADVDTTVTKRTNFLISGEDTGWRKIEKAEEYGAKILTEEEFLSYFPDYDPLF